MTPIATRSAQQDGAHLRPPAHRYPAAVYLLPGEVLRRLVDVGRGEELRNEAQPDVLTLS